ncbi:MAG: sulfate adenylyltransferase [Cycloclasticus sp. Phe_18]|jgi:predicted transglutaminase-like cysteine proteinase|nr:MAG: sulfate adenylyltransferase [Cycloclasticus sp. Phe_18]MDF1689264.1 transglutaminase-like cysteine peptidase [Cycloclasticus sp.]
MGVSNQEFTTIYVAPYRKNWLRISIVLMLLTAAAAPAALNFSAELISKVKTKYGEQASDRVLSWQALIKLTRNLSEQEKLKRVNDFFNQHIEFVDDDYLWGVTDYWATPLEVLAKGAGDCEDYSIAKYFTLKELGVPESKMRITYVKAIELNQAHMVLTYFERPGVVPVVLDNLNPVIKLASKRQDLLPVYSFNGSGLWLAKSRGMGKKLGGSSRLNQWSSLNIRMLSNEF